MTPLNPETRRYVRWVAVLDALEQELARAEGTIETIHDPSHESAETPAATLPSIEELGPLPASLADRATLLGQRQRDVLARAEQTSTAIRRQIRLNQELRIDGESRPVYLDTTG